MFRDFTSEVVEFPSCWKTDKKRHDNTTQTSAISKRDAECSTKKSRNAECQTETLLDLMEATLSQGKDDNRSHKELGRFLAAVEPIVSKQLKVNVAASNFYTSVFKQKEKQSGVGMSCEYLLEEESITSSTTETDIEVTSVSWSCSGATIALAYGTNENIAWSECRSYLCLWNLDRPRLNRRVSDQKLELESSTQVIAFHPQLPGYIAGGLFSGAVFVWDVTADEVSYSASSHEDPVTCLLWLQEKNPKHLRLLTGSSDGSLKIWKYKKMKESAPFQLEKQLSVRGANLSRWAGVHGRGAVGITCMSVATEQFQTDLITNMNFSTSNVLVVGCEVGAVIKCNLDADDGNPVIFTYESHVGPVYSIDWSPFHRHLFLTSSTDQSCRVYHSLQAAPLREFRPEEAIGGIEVNYLFSTLWSLTRPRIVFAVGTRGKVEACDVISGRSISTCDVTDRDGKPCIVNDMKLNGSRRNLIATGSASGNAHVLQIGAQLFETEDMADELSAITELANEAMAND